MEFNTIKEEAKAQLKVVRKNKTDRSEISLQEIVLSQLAGYTAHNPYERSNPRPIKTEANPMVKTRVVIDNQTYAMRVHKSDLNKPGYVRTDRRKTKIKKQIEESSVFPDFSIVKSPYPNVEVRSYVNQVLSIELDQSVVELLTRLKELYARYKDDKGKRKTHKRYVSGLKETLAALEKG